MKWPVVIIHFTEILIFPYQQHYHLIKNLPQLSSSSLTDGRLVFMLIRTIFYQLQLGQLLYLLWRLKASYVTYFCKKACCG
jgi:hypothetical protein